jgi:hypothetical protein
VVFSAAQHDQWAYEMPGRNVGSLSYALSGALREAGPDTTYQVVYEDIKREMQKWVSNRPQIEGAAHAQVFSGRAVRQPPYVPVTGVQQRGARVTVGAGAVAGLLKGSELEVHASGTQVPGDASRLARGRVVDSQPLSATVELSPAVPEARLTGSRAFVTRYSFGDLRIRVGLRDVEPAQTREAIQKHLSRVAAVELVEADPEVVVAAAAGAHALPAPLVVFAPGTGAPILGPLPATDPTTADRIANRLQDYARNQYFRRLKLRSPLLDSKLEIVPLQLDQCSDPAQPTCETCRVQPQPLEGYSTPGGGLRLPVGTYIRLRVHPGRARAFNAVLDLQPDGGINVLWPVPGLQEFTAPGAPRNLDRCFQLGEPTGTEVFVLVSTDTFVDFAPFQTVESLTSRGPAAASSLGPFAPLLNDVVVRSRGAIDVAGAGNASTDMVVFELAPRP